MPERFFTRSTNHVVMKQKLMDEFGFDMDYADDSQCAQQPLYIIYNRLSDFQQRHKTTFQWFKRSFIPDQVIPPIYARSLDITARGYTPSILKFYLDMSVMIDNEELFRFLVTKNIMPDYSSLECAVLAGNKRFFDILKTEFQCHNSMENTLMGPELMREFHSDRLLDLVALSGNFAFYQEVRVDSALPDYNTLINALKSGCIAMVSAIMAEQQSNLAIQNEFLPAAGLSGNVDVIQQLLANYNAIPLQQAHFINLHGNYFFNVGVSENKALIDWSLSQCTTAWDEIFPDKAVIKEYIFCGILKSGNLPLAREYYATWKDEFSATSIEKFYTAALRSDSVPVFDWIKTKYPDYQITVNSKLVEDLLEAQAITTLSNLVFVTRQSFLLDTEFRLFVAKYKAINVNITQLNLAAINFISHPDYGRQTPIMTDDLKKSLHPDAQLRSRAKTNISIMYKFLMDNDALLRSRLDERASHTGTRAMSM